MYSHIKKNAPPLGSHVFQANIIIFELILDIIETKVTTSKTRLFADDGLLYREIRTEADSVELQRDLDALGEWETRRQIHFNP
ncbi:hypothetical protein DPMN_176083 [Dreissena polymorpha]|uniref:Uncharacterized protein n=1 Tax=Dreissena polymorpha TaxID=45954 RepID=A0A9D4IHT2_DREPO|nr:hypothetical protein DPMN_176083 [Dreissena polymorpha]